MPPPPPPLETSTPTSPISWHTRRRAGHGKLLSSPPRQALIRAHSLFSKRPHRSVSVSKLPPQIKEAPLTYDRSVRARPIKLALATLLVAGTTAGCSQTISGEASADSAGAPPSSPMTSESEEQTTEPAQSSVVYHPTLEPLLPALEQMRQWDPCAIHDIDAAEKIFGGPTNYLVPISRIDSCDLSIDHKAGNEALTVEIALTRELLELYRSGRLEDESLAEPIPVYQSKPPEEGVATFGTSCSMFYEVADPYGIKLDVLAVDETPRDQLCTYAEEYFTAVAPKIVDPPLATDGLSTPQRTMLGTDPCLGTIPVLEKYPKDDAGYETYVVKESPYHCAVESDAGFGLKGYEVAYDIFVGVATDARDITFGEDFPAHVDEGITCQYQVFVDPSIKFNVDDPDWPGASPGILIGMNECDDELAEQMFLKLIDQEIPPEITPSPDAIKLGKYR